MNGGLIPAESNQMIVHHIDSLYWMFILPETTAPASFASISFDTSGATSYSITAFAKDATGSLQPPINIAQVRLAITAALFIIMCS